MRVRDCNWMQIEEYLKDDDRIVLPLGSVEQHAQLSLCVDQILPERVAVEAAEPLGVPVLPAQPYGLTPYFAAFPGSPSLSEPTYLALIGDLLRSLHGQGFRRFLIVNGHGGNNPGRPAADAFAAENRDARVIWHNWWNGPEVWPVVQSIDPAASHGSWLENFPWTRLPHASAPPVPKPMIDLTLMDRGDPAAVRRLIGDGSYGGAYQRADEDVLRIWEAGVHEVRGLIENGWSS
ncbi:MAG TPA: creatininase family protein [Solirubrobacteraceae bacterium]|nr:creatininase family protein [Solirubrobacteraceae bacterium]